MNLGEGFVPGTPDEGKLEIFDKWILHRLSAAVRDVNTALEEYRFNEAAHAVYDFWWHDFCDWYLELTKPRIYSKDPTQADSSETAKQVLFHILKSTMLLLHPFMPFITEEIWDRISAGDGRTHHGIAMAGAESPPIDYRAEAEEVEVFKEIVYRIRNIRGEMNIPPDTKVSVIIRSTDKNLIRAVERESVHIKILAKCQDVSVQPGYTPGNTDASAVMTGADIFIPLEGIIDFGRERARLEKEIARIRQELGRVQGKLTNESFIQKAPADIIEKEKGKLDELNAVLSKLTASLEKLG